MSTFSLKYSHIQPVMARKEGYGSRIIKLSLFLHSENRFVTQPVACMAGVNMGSAKAFTN